LPSHHSTTIFLGQLDLVVALEIHEDGLAALVVQVLHLTTVEVDLLDVFARTETLLDQRPGLQVADLDLDEGAEVSRGPVLHLGDEEELAIHHDGHSGGQVSAVHGVVPLKSER
jgi:hypothetical protein